MDELETLHRAAGLPMPRLGPCPETGANSFCSSAPEHQALSPRCHLISSSWGFGGLSGFPDLNSKPRTPQFSPSLSCPSRCSASGRRYFAELRGADLTMALPEVQEAGCCSRQWATEMELLVLRALLVTFKILFYWRIVDLQCRLVSAVQQGDSVIWLYIHILFHCLIAGC